MKLTAPDLLCLGVIDGIISEPEGGAHRNPSGQAALIDRALLDALSELSGLSGCELAAHERHKAARLRALRPSARGDQRRSRTARRHVR